MIAPCSRSGWTRRSIEAYFYQAVVGVSAPAGNLFENLAPEKNGGLSKHQRVSKTESAHTSFRCRFELTSFDATHPRHELYA